MIAALRIEEEGCSRGPIVECLREDWRLAPASTVSGVILRMASAIMFLMDEKDKGARSQIDLQLDMLEILDLAIQKGKTRIVPVEITEAKNLGWPAWARDTSLSSDDLQSHLDNIEESQMESRLSLFLTERLIYLKFLDEIGENRGNVIES